MTIKIDKYYSILGTAAAIDRAEVPYLLAHKIPDTKQYACELVVPTESTGLVLLCAVMSTMGEMLANSNEDTAEAMRSQGLNTEDSHLVLGAFSAFTSAMAKLPSQAAKEALASLAAKTVHEMVLNGKSIEQVQADLKARKGTQFHE